MIASVMTSEAESRRLLVALLIGGSKRRAGSVHRGAYPVGAANERAWLRATEQERRRMLKDCGWL